MGTWFENVEGSRMAHPACGFIGCVGGWTEILTGISKPAMEILGLTVHQSNDLFFSRRVVAHGPQGGKRHAEFVIAHLLKFAAAREQQLRHHMITPIPSRRRK